MVVSEILVYKNFWKSLYFGYHLHSKRQHVSSYWNYEQHYNPQDIVSVSILNKPGENSEEIARRGRSDADN